jgi:hypothetical protein
MAVVSAGLLAIHSVLPEDAMVCILSHLEYMDLSHVLCASKSIQSLRDLHNNCLERSLFSRVEIFDRTQWKEYWGAEITDKYEPNKIELRVLRAFLKCYWGPNPIGPGKVKDNCLIPAVKPAKATLAGVVLDYSLNVAELLAKQPKKGHAAKYMKQTEALEQYGDAGTEKDELVILLKGVVARSKPWSKDSQEPSKRGKVEHLRDLNASTGYGCETEPDALSQNTVLFAHHAVTGERPFGDDTGMEGRYTYGRTREEVRSGKNAYHMISGCFSAGQVLDPLEGSALAELCVSDDRYGCGSRGVGVVRKF